MGIEHVTSLQERGLLNQWITLSFNKICTTASTLLSPSSATLNFSHIISEDLDKQVEEALKILDILQDFVWEKLNIGHWKDIPVVWQKLFSLLVVFKVSLLAAKGCVETPEVIKMCDNGLLMGYPIFGNILAVLAQAFHDQLNCVSTSTRVASKVEKRQNTEEGNYSEHWSLPTATVPLPGDKISIHIVDKPSLEYFNRNHFLPQLPLVLKNSITHWPASSKWSPTYIVQVGGNRTVPVEIGSKYTADDWTQKLMTIEEFVQTYMKSSIGSQVHKEIGYVAQHMLFQQMPELMKDIRVPEYCCLGENQDVEINAWFGPSGTLTPTHYDPKHNFLCQVFGSKFVRLFPPSESQKLYPYEEGTMLFNTSQVDMEDSNAIMKFPDIATATYADILLTEGDMLYIPPKWWHMVKSLSPSFSVSFWFE